jgi:outer membrane protein TolC
VANNNLNLAIKQYKQGLINISERLEAENDSYKASVNKINILIEQRLSALETIIATELTKNTYQIKVRTHEKTITLVAIACLLAVEIQ